MPPLSTSLFFVTRLAILLFRTVLVTIGLPVALVLILAQASQAQTFTVTNTNDSGLGSLLQAMLDANANAGTDTITFNITGSGVHTIAPLSVLPTITDPVIIDGYTQPGASANTLAVGSDAVLLIEIDGINVNTFNDTYGSSSPPATRRCAALSLIVSGTPTPTPSTAAKLISARLAGT
ncbi:MAG: hypothetical protein ABR568_09595 [Pyrinomonadaceae bacterium]